MASESCKFKYVCRGCGESWFFPPSETRCEWCDTLDPFGGDPGKCRPAVITPQRDDSGKVLQRWNGLTVGDGGAA